MNRSKARPAGLYVDQGGRSNGPTLLLMHGLSGTGALWRGLIDILDREWPGRWIAPDMRGHGRSDHAATYGIGLHAADMASLVTAAGAAEDLYIAGHSMGGLVGIMLASGWFGVRPKAVVTAGVKIGWSEEERAGIAKLIDAPVRRFDTESEARERYVLVTGLKGILDPSSEIAATGIIADDGKWRLAADNRAAMVAYADTVDIYNAAQAPVTLAAGERDRMVSIEEQRDLDPASVRLDGLGHNAHVEDPAAFWRLIERVLEKERKEEK